MANKKLCAEQKVVESGLSDLCQEIREVMSKVVEVQPNPHKNKRIITCWEVKRCAKNDCPAYKSENLYCWQIPGTYCGDNVQRSFVQKYMNCKDCEVFKTACKVNAAPKEKKVDNVVDLLERKKQKNNSLVNALESLSKNSNYSEKQNVIDNLTGLYTRNYLLTRFASETARAKLFNRPLSLLVIDIDTFRKYNDDFGHIAGDLLLKKFAEILRNVTRETDFVCRFGGDEFVLVLPDAHIEIALMVAERIRMAFKSQAFYPDEEKEHDSPVNKTVSIGICSVASNSEFVNKLIKKASSVMLKAKQAGGDKVKFHTSSVMSSIKCHCGLDAGRE